MDYLYIITKQEFTSLYRFGFIPITQEKLLELKGLSAKDIEADIIKSFMSLPFFIGDEEYIFVRFDKTPQNCSKLNIEDVLEIIPLTDAARHSYQMKFDKKIVFSQAKFEKVVHKVEEQIDIQERLNGAKVFWNLCQVKEPFRELISTEKIKEAYQKRIDGLKSDNFASDFFVHTLVYERYDFFPNSDLGFLYDVGEIFAHSKQKPSFKGSSYHSFLEQNKPIFESKDIVELIDIISSEPEIVKFTEKLTNNGLKIYLIAVLFFKFKSDLQEKDSIKGSKTGEIIRNLKNKTQYKTELNYVIYLTGSFFGYGKFYDDLYEIEGLSIIKTLENPVEKNRTNESIKETVELKENNTCKELNNEKTLKPDNDIQNKVELPNESETEKVDTKITNKRTLINQIKDFIKKSGGILQVNEEVYKEIKNIIHQEVEITKDLKKADYLNKINELTDDSFEIDLKKEVIKIKDNKNLFTNT